MKTTSDSSSPTSLDEELMGSLPAFRQPSTMPKDDPLPSSTTTRATSTTTSPSSSSDLIPEPPASSTMSPSLPTSPGGADGFDEDDLEMPPLDLSSTPSSSPASIARRGATAAALRPPIEAVVRMAGLGVHMKLAPGENDLWLLDDQDADMIAGPLASIAARHAPISAGDASDVSDGIEFAVGVTAYTLKNFQRQKASQHWLEQQAQEQAS